MTDLLTARYRVDMHAWTLEVDPEPCPGLLCNGMTAATVDLGRGLVRRDGLVTHLDLARDSVQVGGYVMSPAQLRRVHVGIRSSDQYESSRYSGGFRRWVEVAVTYYGTTPETVRFSPYIRIEMEPSTISRVSLSNERILGDTDQELSRDAVPDESNALDALEEVLRRYPGQFDRYRIDRRVVETLIGRRRRTLAARP